MPVQCQLSSSSGRLPELSFHRMAAVLAPTPVEITPSVDVKTVETALDHAAAESSMRRRARDVLQVRATMEAACADAEFAPESLLDDHPDAERCPWTLCRFTRSQLAAAAAGDDDLADQVLAAIQEAGMLLLCATDEEHAMLSEASDTARTFFDGSDAEKREYAEQLVSGAFVGYQALAFDNTRTKRQPELREVFEVVPALADRHRWPAEDFKRATIAAADWMSSVGKLLLAALSHALFRSDKLSELAQNNEEKVEEDARAVSTHFPRNNLCYFKYDDAFGYDSRQNCMPHEDAGLVTLLPRTDAAGLQAFDWKREQWVSVEEQVGEQEVMVYVGKLLEYVCNGKVRALTHRVVRYPHLSRLSMPYELKPKADAIVTRGEGDDDVLWRVTDSMHPAICDMCRKHITGRRWKCTVCEDYDECASCLARAEDKHEHAASMEEQFILHRTAGPMKAEQFLASVGSMARRLRWWRLYNHLE
eukprot:PLAT6042.1.p2 GENE.PLAT6042.1~~PLAT6042.1.p2  ORF type:complete len:477 (+),score=116.36 PLAT6042.1:3365-4795(+)